MAGAAARQLMPEAPLRARSSGGWMPTKIAVRGCYGSWGIRTCCGTLSSRVSASDGASSSASLSETPPVSPASNRRSARAGSRDTPRMKTRSRGVTILMGFQRFCLSGSLLRERVAEKRREIELVAPIDRIENEAELIVAVQVWIPRQHGVLSVEEVRLVCPRWCGIG